MRSKMLNKIVLSTERAGTLRAIERLFLSMRSKVPLEVLKPLELPPAEVKGTLVDSIVIIEAIGTVGELRGRIALSLDQRRTAASEVMLA
jgi:hypothetical protein